MAKKKEDKIKVKAEKEKTALDEQWDPFRTPAHLGNTFFDDPWVHPWFRRRGWRDLWPGLWFGKGVKEATVDFKETKSEYQVFAETPGIPKDNIEVHITPHNMAIRGEIKSESKEEKEGYVWRERGYSTLCRAVHFPEEVVPEKAEAVLKDGILEVTIPKKKLGLEEKGKRIAVK